MCAPGNRCAGPQSSGKPRQLATAAARLLSVTCAGNYLCGRVLRLSEGLWRTELAIALSYQGASGRSHRGAAPQLSLRRHVRWTVDARESTGHLGVPRAPAAALQAVERRSLQADITTCRHSTGVTSLAVCGASLVVCCTLGSEHGCVQQPDALLASVHPHETVDAPRAHGVASNPTLGAGMLQP